VAFEQHSLKLLMITIAALTVCLDIAGYNFSKYNVFSDANFIQYSSV